MAGKQKRPPAVRTPAASCVAGVVWWALLHEPLHWAGLAILLGLAFVIIPVLLMVVVFGVPVLLSGIWPRRWRKWYRDSRPREEQKSSYIPRWLRNAVLAADRGTCVYFGEDCNGSMQIDHSIPWSIGGLTAFWNLFTLCAYHNRIKSNYWVSPSGKVYYRPYENASNEAMAAGILHYERMARLHPLRWLRAAHAIGWL